MSEQLELETSFDQLTTELLNIKTKTDSDSLTALSLAIKSRRQLQANYDELDIVNLSSSWVRDLTDTKYIEEELDQKTRSTRIKIQNEQKLRSELSPKLNELFNAKPELVINETVTTGSDTVFETDYDISNRLSWIGSIACMQITSKPYNVGYNAVYLLRPNCTAPLRTQSSKPVTEEVLSAAGISHSNTCLASWYDIRQLVNDFWQKYHVDKIYGAARRLFFSDNTPKSAEQDPSNNASITVKIDDDTVVVIKEYTSPRGSAHYAIFQAGTLPGRYYIAENSAFRCKDDRNKSPDNGEDYAEIEAVLAEAKGSLPQSSLF